MSITFTPRVLRRFLIVSHRWLSLVLGLVLVLICTSGAVLLYRPELQRHIDHAAYATSGGQPVVTMQQAADAVTAAHPDFQVAAVIKENGVLRVTDYTNSWTVDPATGKVLGKVGQPPWFMNLLDNFHECFLTCEGMPGYVPLFAKGIPGTSWLSDDGRLDTGDLVLGLFALVLLYLSLTGLWLWFPRPRQWRSAMSVRWRRGRFARDTDLHKVVGMIALVPLLMWAVTTAGWEFKQANDVYYALTPGAKVTLPDDVTSASADGTDIGIDAAVAPAQAAYPKDTVVAVSPPD